MEQVKEGCFLSLTNFHSSLALDTSHVSVFLRIYYEAASLEFYIFLMISALNVCKFR